MRKIWDVVVVGEFYIDEILSDFSTLPKLGEESFAKRFQREIGGGAAITACGLARLGLKVAVLGVVGKQDGAWLIERLIDCGVNAAGLHHHPDEPTGLTVSVSTREDRAFFSYHGANKGLPRVLRDHDARKLMAKARHVHFACSPDPQLDTGLFRALRLRRCRVSIDVGGHASWLTDPQSIDILRQIDLFLPNEREAELMTGQEGPHEILRFLRDRRLRAVALKLGGKGAALLWKKQEFVCDPFPVAHIDTTGAGDCFDAGFIYAWLQAVSPQNCLRTANACGALSTRALGGIASFPTLKELNTAMKEE